jgi:DNA-binding transcriptional ArsR family regulator
MQDEMCITSAAAAAVFAVDRQRRLVESLIGSAMTLSALAHAVEMPLSLAHYHVARLLALGLIEIEREERRAGRAVKHYRAAAWRFFVPAELLPGLPSAGLNQRMRATLDEHLVRSLEGMIFGHDGKFVSMQLRRHGNQNGNSMELWLDIGLSRADSTQLMAELRGVVDRYRTRGSPTEPQHLVHVAMARL